MDLLNISAKFEVRSFTHSWDNRGYSKNLGSPWICPCSLFSQIFKGLLFAWTLWIYLPNLKFVALPNPEIIGGTVIGRLLSRLPLRIFTQTLYYRNVDSLNYILPQTVCVCLHSTFSDELRKTILFRRRGVSAVKVIQGHWYWCQSKARIWLPISP